MARTSRCGGEVEPVASGRRTMVAWRVGFQKSWRKNLAGNEKQLTHGPSMGRTVYLGTYIIPYKNHPFMAGKHTVRLMDPIWLTLTHRV